MIHSNMFKITKALRTAHKLDKTCRNVEKSMRRKIRMSNPADQKSGPQWARPLGNHICQN